MQIGLSYPIDGKTFVAVTMQSEKGMISEGLSSELARQYAEMLVKCADLLDRMDADEKEE